MKKRTEGNICLVYSAASEPLAVNILRYAVQCNAWLERLFEPPQPVHQKVYWLAKADWRSKPERYGFPYAGGNDAFLAAADVDLPTQLALIADSMDIARGGTDIDRLAVLLRLPERTPTALYRHLKQSKEFMIVYTAYFILPHELTHGYCNALGYPPLPRWYYEGLAQWAAYQMQTELRGADEADAIYAYYQLLWDRGTDLMPVRDFTEADRRGAGALGTPNYAWYHAGLLRMFRELEAMSAEPLLPQLVKTVGREYRGARIVPEPDMVRAFSAATGRDLRTWFVENWGIAAGK